MFNFLVMFICNTYSVFSDTVLHLVIFKSVLNLVIFNYDLNLVIFNTRLYSLSPAIAITEAGANI